MRSLIIMLALAAVVGCSGKKAEQAKAGAKHGGVPTSREGQMFLLGMKLSQAAQVNGRAAPDVVERTFKAASTIADITLHTKLDPLPSLTGDKIKDDVEGLGYLLRGQGKTLGPMIAKDFGDTSAAAYELGIKLNMVPNLYTGDPKDEMSNTFAEVLSRLSTRLKLPGKALDPLISKLRAHAPQKEVIELAFDLNETLPVALAAIYEKDNG